MPNLLCLISLVFGAPMAGGDQSEVSPPTGDAVLAGVNRGRIGKTEMACRFPQLIRPELTPVSSISQLQNLCRHFEPSALSEVYALWLTHGIQRSTESLAKSL